MKTRIGIRLEDKNIWERRVALTPSDVEDLTSKGVSFFVERFERRAFKDEEYLQAGAELVNDVRHCEFVAGIKEMPVDYFRPGGAYMFFSHTIKGQDYNMKLLGNMVKRGCTLIDYERVVDEKGRRLIFFGRYAGLAGMIDTLWTLGKRLKVLGYTTPFLGINPTHTYKSLDAAKSAVIKAGKHIKLEGLPSELCPFVFGITGYGHVSQGAQEILDLLPLNEVDPLDLEDYVLANKNKTKQVTKVVYHEHHLAAPMDSSKSFELQEYYDHPKRHKGIFEPNLSLLNVLVNGIYWDEQYPKLADAEQLKQLFSGRTPRLVTVGDITCDIDGSLACTVRDTEPGDPVYVYNTQTREGISGFEGPGLAVMAVGNLPTELPLEASMTFSHALETYVPDIANTDFQGSFEDAALPAPLKRAVVLWRGEFTPNYQYMSDFLK